MLFLCYGIYILTGEIIGLAVSGGGDSMALTFLFSELVSKKLLPGLAVKAYIVDHQYRAESTREAYTVANWVKSLGRHYVPFTSSNCKRYNWLLLCSHALEHKADLFSTRYRC